jgi:hypothetical protein
MQDRTMLLVLFITGDLVSDRMFLGRIRKPVVVTKFPFANCDAHGTGNSKGLKYPIGGIFHIPNIIDVYASTG